MRQLFLVLCLFLLDMFDWMCNLFDIAEGMVVRGSVCGLSSAFNVSHRDSVLIFKEIQIMTTALVTPARIETRVKIADSLHVSCRKNSEETFLYRYQSGDLRLSDTRLHTGKEQYCSCDERQRTASGHVDRFQLIASGSHEDMLGLAHSLMLGLDEPMRGI